MKKLVAGNWKMHGLSEDIAILKDIAVHTRQATACRVLVCPPTTLLAHAHQVIDSDTGLHLGGQDCHTDSRGAHTGDIAAVMLADAGATSVIVGHSERRANHAESDEIVRAKVHAAWEAGLQAIVCIGETEADYKAGRTLEVLKKQLDGSLPDTLEQDKTVLAYEPVWAIGTGLTPTLDEIQETHTAINDYIKTRFGQPVQILYGGSVKPNNAGAIFALDHVSGALVGGASLKAQDFCAIIDAACEGAPA